MHDHKTVYADDDKESISLLLRLRLPPLMVGLILGIGISFLLSRFEEVLATNIRAAFFIPFVVYIADAIGTQTQTIYARDLKSGHAKFWTYLLKESALGVVLGLLFGAISYAIAALWLGDIRLAIGVSFAVLYVCIVAPVVALIVTELLNDIHEDPAVGSGPLATVIQDAISILIYGAVLSLVLL